MNYIETNVVEPPGGALIRAKIPDWISNNLTGRKNPEDHGPVSLT